MRTMTGNRSSIVRSAVYGLLLVTCTTGISTTDLHAQLLAPQRKFQQTFGTIWNERTEDAHPLERLKDGGYIMVGSRELTSSSKAVTFRATISGNQIGPAQSYVSGTFGCQGTDVAVTNDGGYAVLGNRNAYFTVGNSIPGDIMVVKTDGAGNVAWKKWYGTLDDREQGYAIQQTSDGGYIVAGYMVDIFEDVGDVFLMRLNSNGTIKWQKAYNDFTWNYAAYSVQEASDGGFIVAGTVRKSGSDKNAFLFKVNSDGNYQWFKEYGVASSTDIFYSVAKTSDGYIASGTRGNDIYVVRVKSDGTFNWSKTYNGPGNGVDVGYDIKLLPADNFAVAGQVDGNTACLLRLKSNGDVDWARGYAPAGTTTVARSVVRTDLGYALGGEVSSNSTDWFLVKTDGNGDSYCNNINLTITTTTRNESGASILLHGMIDKPVVVYSDIIIDNPVISQSTLCYNESSISISDLTLRDNAQVQSFRIGAAIDDNDGIDDPIEEPAVIDGHAWASDGIWVRAEQDEVISARTNGSLYANELRHQNPDFSLGTNYIYVMVENAGNAASSPAELEVYWSIASTNTAWPSHWDNYTGADEKLYGDLVSTVTIPALAAGELYVAEIPWTTPDPGDYDGTTPAVSFLARISTASDPMAFPEVANTEQNAINNNNIIWKNEMVVTDDDMTPGSPDGKKTIFIRNTGAEQQSNTLTFRVPQPEVGINPLLADGSVTVDLGATLYTRWLNAGGTGTNVDDLGDGMIAITGEDATINGISLNAGEEYPIGITFEFGGAALDFPQYYHYEMIQSNGIGGVSFELRFPATAPGAPKKVAPENGETPAITGLILESHPNPMTLATSIDFELPDAMRVQLAIYDVAGQLVRVIIPEQTIAAGMHTLLWDGTDDHGTPIGSGIYVCRLMTPAGGINRQLLIVR